MFMIGGLRARPGAEMAEARWWVQRRARVLSPRHGSALSPWAHPCWSPTRTPSNLSPRPHLRTADARALRAPPTPAGLDVLRPLLQSPTAGPPAGPTAVPFSLWSCFPRLWDARSGQPRPGRADFPLALARTVLASWGPTHTSDAWPWPSRGPRAAQPVWVSDMRPLAFSILNSPCWQVGQDLRGPGPSKHWDRQSCFLLRFPPMSCNSESLVTCLWINSYPFTVSTGTVSGDKHLN